MKRPMCRPCSSGSPQNTGSFALGDDVVGDRHRPAARSAFCSGPPRPNSQTPDPDRDPVEHDRRDHLVGARASPSARPAIPAHSAPAERSPATMREHDVQQRAACPRTTSRPRPRRYEPTRYWPWPPMLNRPQRNANATARPVRISGVVRISVCCRFSAAIVRSVAADPREEPVQPGAVEDRLVGRDRVVAGDAARRARRRRTRAAP